MNFISDVFSHADIQALDQIFRQYATPEMIAVELGSYTGRSSTTMLPYIKAMNGMLYCVDTFKGSEGTDPTHSYARQNVLTQFRSNIREGGFDDYVTIVIGTSLNASKLVGENSVDLVFIDADHRYDHVVEDILAWYPKVKSGGIICGHDYDPPDHPLTLTELSQYSDLDFTHGTHFGVVRAVQEFFPQVQHLANVWFVVKGQTQHALLESALAIRKQARRAAPASAPQHIFHMTAGETTEKAGDLDAALRHYLAAAKAYNRYLPAYHALTRVLVALGHTIQAIDVLLEAKRHCPEAQEISLSLANLLARQSRNEEAIACLLEVLQARPATPEILSELIHLYRKCSRFAESAQCLFQFLELESPHKPLYAEMAHLAIQQHEIRAARIALRRLSAADAHPNLQDALRSLIQSHSLPAT